MPLHGVYATISVDLNGENFYIASNQNFSFLIFIETVSLFRFFAFNRWFTGHSLIIMSFQSFLNSQLKLVSQVLSTSRWFASEHVILATLLLAITFLSVETLATHEYNPEPVALMAKVKAQTTVVVAQAVQVANQK